MKRGGKLGAFQGLQFFINSKGHKHRVKADEFSKLMMCIKRSFEFALNDRSRATLAPPKSISIGFIRTSVL